MKLVKTVLSIVVVFLCVGLSYGQTSAELKRQRERLNREINLLNQSLKKTSSEKTLTRACSSAPCAWGW